MARFLIRRIFAGLIVMFLMTITVFIIFFIGPGPSAVARTLAGRQATPAQVAAVSHRLLLDRPYPVQYGHFLWLLLHGNLGFDYYHDQSVNSIIAAAFPITLSLLIGAAILWLTIGILTGIVSAVRTRSLCPLTIIRATHREVEVYAKVVVLAASCVETAHIMLNSRSRHWPTGIANSSGQLGKNLTDHLYGSPGYGYLPQLLGQPSRPDNAVPAATA